jgi:hypothetical protein
MLNRFRRQTGVTNFVAGLSDGGQTVTSQGNGIWDVECANPASNYSLRIVESPTGVTFGTNLVELAAPEAVPVEFYRGLTELGHKVNYGSIGTTGPFVTMTREMPGSRIGVSNLVQDSTAFDVAQEAAFPVVLKLAADTGTGLII